MHPRAVVRFDVVAPGQSRVMFLLIVLVIVLALAAGVLGTLLEVAAWLLLALIVVGAVLGYLLWRAVSRRAGGTGTSRP